MTVVRPCRQTHLVMENTATIEQVEPKDDNLTKVTDWIDRPGKAVLYTHANVDADAAFSAALMLMVREGAQGPNSTDIEFLPTDATVDTEDALAVDMMNGSSAIKGIDTGSAFGELVSILVKAELIPHRLYKNFAEQLNLTDSGKRCNDRVALAGLVKSWTYSGLCDREIVSRAREILGGMMKGMVKHRRRRIVSSRMPIHDGVALNLSGGGLDRRTLSRRGAFLVINQHEDIGQSVVLTSRGTRAELDLNDLRGALPERWFIHPNGFIACYGSMKGKKNPEDSGITLATLCKEVHDWLIGALGFTPDEVLL